MPQQIEVPGQGILEFPDGMGDDAIKDVIKRKFIAPAAAIGAQAPQAITGQVLRTLQLGSLARPDPVAPSMGLPSVPFGPAPPLTALAIPGRVPLPALHEDISSLAQAVPPGTGPVSRAGSALAKTGLGFAAGAVSPDNLLAEIALATPAAPLAKAYFGYQMGKGAAEAGKELYRQFTGPRQEQDPQKAIDALVGGAAMGIGVGEIGKGLYQEGRAALQPPIVPTTQGPAPAARLTAGMAPERATQVDLATLNDIVEQMRRNQILKEQHPPVVVEPPKQAEASAPQVAGAASPLVTPKAAPSEAPIGSVKAVPPEVEAQAAAISGREVKKVSLDDFVPAVELPSGEIRVATPQQATHSDILQDLGLDPKAVDYDDPNRFFVNPTTGERMSRKELSEATGVPGTAFSGGIDSHDLPRVKAAQMARLEAGLGVAEQVKPQQQEQAYGQESQGRVPSSQPSVGQELRDVQKQGSGAEAVAAGPQVQKEVSPLRQEVEGQTDLLHRMNNVANLIGDPSIPTADRERLRGLASKVSVAFKAGRPPEVLKALVDNLEERVKDVREPEAPMKERDVKEMLPPQAEPKLEGPSLVREFKRLRLTPDKEGFFNRPQLVNTLRNRLHPDEWEIYRSMGIEKLPERIKAEDVAKWMEENGPRVEVRVGRKESGKLQRQEIQDAERQMLSAQHILETRGYKLTPVQEGPLVGGLVTPDGKYIVARGDTLYEYRAGLYEPEYIGQSRLSEADEHVQKYFAGKSVWDRIAQTQEPGTDVHWSSIAPKSESDMPGYVEGAVTLPTEREGIKNYTRQEQINEPSVLFPSSHSFPPNTLGFFRGYMETRPDGGKTFHVIEVQSDWEKQLRYDEGYTELGRGLHQTAQPHPLLKHWETLTLKAAIEHARKEGADRIAVSDAETAMMTEGHERQLTTYIDPTPENIAVAKKYNTSLSREVLASLEKGKPFEAGSTNPFGPEKHMRAIDAEKAGFKVSQRPSQEPGMRLHYDQILPRILEKLTGAKGTKVEFGEHRMALTYGEGRNESRLEKRHDLIFKTPTGEPKTTVTATEFPLAKTQEQFSLFGKDRPSLSPQEAPRSQGQILTKTAGRETTFERAIAGLTPEQQVEHRALGLEDGASLHSVIEKLGETEPLARFLAQEYEHVLRVTGIDPGTGRRDRANYDPLGKGAEGGAPVAFLDIGGHSDIKFKLLEEATHAATYWQFRHPTTEVQRAAKANMEALFELSKKIGEGDYSLSYRHSDLNEFIAGLISDPNLRAHLENIKFKANTAWEQVVHWVKDLLGIAPNTAYERAFDQLIQVGQDRGGIDQARARYGLDPVGAPPSVRGEAVLDQTTSEYWNAKYNNWRGYTVPKHVAASETAANWLVKYASSRVAAPDIARSRATDVLGPKWKDTNFSSLLGAVLVEDRLRAIKSTFEKLSEQETDPVKKAEFLDKAGRVTSLVGMQGSPFRDESAFTKISQHADMTAAIERHKTLIQPTAEMMHRTLGGELAAPGENTGAFVNLIAMLNPDDVESSRSMIFSSRKGDPTNPRLRPSVFSRQATGSAPAYNLDYRAIAERMIRGNYEQYALKKYYESLVTAGLAVEAKPGQEAPKTLKGEALTKVEIKPGRAFITGKNLWIRKDLEPEFRQAVAVDKAPPTALHLLLDLATDAQVIGPTDLFWHSVNMVGVLAGSQGSRSWFYDVLKKSTPIGFVDAFVRMSYNGFVKPMLDNPEVQRAIAEYSEVGAGRPKPVHQGGIISKVVTKATGVPIEKTQIGDPFYHLNQLSSKILRGLDQGGRISALNMYKHLIDRKVITDSELNKREFINRMGQYNSRLMPHWQALMRENSFSSFVVAGKNMNRQALRKVIFSPGFQAANREAWVKARAAEVISYAALVYTLPVLANLIINGEAFPKNTPIGAVPYGPPDKDGRRKMFDPLQLFLIRRGRRMLGLEAYTKGQQEHLTPMRTAKDMAHEAFNAYVHPWIGPSVRTIGTALTGKDVPSGYLLSRNPTSEAENIITALKNANPTVAAFFKDAERGEPGQHTALRNLGSAVGFKQTRPPTQLQRLDAEALKQGVADYEHMTLSQKRQAQVEVEKTKPTKSLQASRAAAVQAEWSNFARQDALLGSLPRDQQEFLRTNKLSLPGFQSELTLGKVRLPETPKEQEKMMGLVSKEYQKMIAEAMSRSAPVNQKQLNLMLDLARKRARVAYKASLGQ